MSRDARLVMVRTAIGRGDYASAARQLRDGWRDRSLTLEDLREWLPLVWTSLDPPAGPHGPLGDEEWVELFDGLGSDMQPPDVDLGPEPYVLYRAAPPERVRGMSWCTHEAMARGFLPKHDRFGRDELWTGVVPRSAVLAVLYRRTDTFFGRGSDDAREVVVNPEGLMEVTPVR